MINETNNYRTLIRRLMPLMIPMTSQFFVASIIGAANTIMMGMIDETSLSAISIGNQVMNIYMAGSVGLCIGASALFAQYWGTKDLDDIAKAECVAIRVSTEISIVVFLVTLIFPDSLAKFYTTDPTVIEMATDYLRITSVAYLALGFSQIYQMVLKNTGRVTVGMVYNMIAGISGIVIGAVLVFGLFGCPKMGLTGAAIAVTMSRLIEFTITFVDCKRNKSLHIELKDFFRKHAEMRERYLKYTRPAFIGNAGWNIAVTVTVAIIGHMGTTALAAYSASMVLYNVFASVAQGMGNSVGIIVGNELGQDNLAEARKLGDMCIRMAAVLGLLTTLAMFATSRLVGLMNDALADDVRHYMSLMMIWLSIKVAGAIINTTFYNGIFVAGGDNLYMTKLDMSNLWLFIIPLGLVCANLLKLPLMVVFLAVNIEEFTKMPLEIRRYKKYLWLRNITVN